MLGILIKKELKGFFSGFLRSRKGGYLTGNKAVLIALLFVILFCSWGSMFYGLSLMLVDVIGGTELEWFYFSLEGLVALSCAVIAGMFAAYSSIYKAKDNELLLSMPVKPKDILISRMVGVYVLDFIFTLLTVAPVTLSYCLNVKVSASVIISAVLLLIIISIAALVISCLLGFVVAIIAKRLVGLGKNIITIIISLAAFGLYYLFTSKMSEYMGQIVNAREEIAASWGGKYNPLYMMGKAGCGDFGMTGLLAIAVLLLLAICAFILTKSFVGLATAKETHKSKAYAAKDIQSASVGKALLSREFKHYINSPAYMLNCSLGTVFTIAATVFILIKIDYNSAIEFASSLTGTDSEKIIPLIICMAICALSTMNDLTAPSISLEGKNFWIIKSSPISSKQILNSKLSLHLILTSTPTLISAIIFIIVLKVSILDAIVVILTTQLFVLFSGEFGLLVNVLKPNFVWVNETAAVKQSLSTLFALLGLMVFAVILFAPFFIWGIDAKLYFYLVFGIMVLLAVVFTYLHLTFVRRKFEEISA